MAINSSSRSSFSSSHLPSSSQTAEVLELLRSNRLPMDPPGFRSTIASSLADVACYNIEIERLVAERDALKQYCDQCSSVLAPVKRLPIEILVEIFTLCSSTPRLFCDWTQDVSDPVDQPHPMNLLQVCSSWYEIVVGTPSLWSNIKLDFERITDEELIMAYLSRSLDRSQPHPLTMYVNSWQEDYCFLELLRNAPRWRMVDLCIDFDGEHPHVLRSHVPGNLPLLERLELGGDCADLDIFETAPKLAHVMLSNVVDPLPKLPWSQLRELTYYASEPVPVVENVIAHRLRSMSRCSSDCEFNFYDLNISDFNLFTTAALFSFRIQSNIPVLRLALLDENDEDHSRPILGAIIGTLVLPRLLELHFRSFSPDNYPIFWPRDDFMAFSNRSSLGNTLTKLFLYHMAITEDELVECLSEMKVLLELFIQEVAAESDWDLITDTLLHRLTWRDDSSCLVPHLHCFSFDPLYFSFGEDTFIEFVESRLVPGRSNNGPFTIQAFYADDHWFEDALIARMTALHTQGLLHWSLQDRKFLRQQFSDIHRAFSSRSSTVLHDLFGDSSVLSHWNDISSPLRVSPLDSLQDRSFLR
ncbi:hypothetical protein C8R45DRAFT_1212700 [Mycena sanguinolenta]|nr:hypothetical protein C8R45DRAFT_1212700 [Mycena sanguinolenta]